MIFFTSQVFFLWPGIGLMIIITSEKNRPTNQITSNQFLTDDFYLSNYFRVNLSTKTENPPSFP